MSPTFLRALWIAAAFAFAAVAGTSWRTLVDSVGEDRYGRELRRAQALHAELDEYVMKCRTGLATSYDPLEQTLAELDRVHARSAEMPRLLGPGGREEVSTRRRVYGEALAEKKFLIDDFERENSVLRNSLRYAPVLARELADKLELRLESQELSRRVHDLLGEVLSYNLLPDKEIGPRVDRAIAALQSADLDAMAVADRKDVAVLLTHARTITRHKPRVDDLMDRILRLPIADRALRERVVEIEELAMAFVANACRNARRSRVPSLSDEALELLEMHGWPGNVRVLQNVMERALVLCDGDRLEPKHLPVKLVTASVAAPPPSVPPSSDSANAVAELRHKLKTVDRQRIVEALEKCSGNQTHAAALLGMSRRTLVARLGEYDLPRPRKK